MAVRVGGAFVRVVACGMGVVSIPVSPCDVGRAVTVAVARYDTAVRVDGAGVVVVEGLIGTGVAAGADAAGVVAAVGARDAAAVAVPAAAAPPATLPPPLSTVVATADAVIAGTLMAPGLTVVTVGVAVGPPVRRAADVIVPAPPLEFPAPPPLEAAVAEA